MAQKLHKLALEIQGRLDGSLGNAIKTTQGQLNELNDRVKTFRNGQQKLRGTDAVYIQNANSARELGKTLLDLKRTQSDVSHLQERRKSTADLGRSFMQARREATALTAAYESDKSAKNKAAMQAAIKNAQALDKSYKKQREALKMVEERLSKAGVNTKKYSDEQKRLASEIEKSSKEQQRFNDLNDKLAQKRAYWQGLRSEVGKYASAAWRAAKWTAGITASLSALGYGTYKFIESTAEAGDSAAKLGRAVRASSEDIQMLRGVAAKSNVGDFDNTLKKMREKISSEAAKKTENISEVFSKYLNLDPKNLSGTNAVKALEVLSIKFSKITDPKQKILAAKELFEDDWVGMLDMLGGGYENLRKEMEKIKSFGLISNETSARSEEFLNNVADMKAAVSGLKNSIGEELLPIMNEAVKEATEWVKQNKELVSSEIKDWIESLKKKLPEIIDGFKAFGEGVGKVSDFFSKLIDLIGGTETAATGLAIYLGTKAFLGPIKALAAMVGAAASGGAAAGGASAAGAGGTAAVGGAAAVGLGSVLGAAAVTAVPLLISAYRKEIQDWYESDMSPEELQKSKELREYRSSLETPSRAGSLGFSVADLRKNINSQNTEIATQNMTANAGNIEINGQPQPEITQGKARGGLVSTPTISKLAERCPEIVVPLGDSDKGRGKFWLSEAARKLGMQVSERGEFASRPPQAQITTNFSSEPPKNDSKTARSKGMPQITFAPVYHITGAEPEKTAQMVDEVTRSSFAEMIEEYFAGKERLAYDTT